MRYLWLIICMLYSPLYASSSFCDGTLNAPCIVQDTNAGMALKHFRDSNQMANQYKGNKHGLDTLWISGSAVPNEEQFAIIREHVILQATNSPRKIVIVDLRQESHGYLNGQAINLTVEYNWINRYKSHFIIPIEEATWLSSLRKQKVILNVLTPLAFKSQQYTTGSTIIIDSVVSEKKTVSKVHLDYQHFLVNDHMAPQDEVVDQFIEFVKRLPPKTWIHFHCRGGDGRTTTFMAMYDMLKNANKVSFDEILARQASVDPFYDLQNTQRKHPELTTYYVDRLHFLRKFYLFAKYYQLHPDKWSVWLKKQQF